MEKVLVDGVALSSKTSKGREVQVLRGDNGSHWGFKFGPEDDQISFCLSGEALELMLAMIRSLKPAEETAWIVTLNDPTTKETASSPPPQS